MPDIPNVIREFWLVDAKGETHKFHVGDNGDMHVTYTYAHHAKSGTTRLNLIFQEEAESGQH